MAERFHRKPVGPMPPVQHVPQYSQQQQYSAGRYQAHSRTRTTSSSNHPNFPPSSAPAIHPDQPSPHRAQYPVSLGLPGHVSQPTGRQSAQSQGNLYTMTNTSPHQPTSVNYRQPSLDLRRTASARSNGHVSGYVALMRKQKATVWCDRSQHEDPRLLAQHKAAKARAALEVSGGNVQGRLSTSGSGNAASKGGVTAKIRHHGKANLVGYTPGDLVGGGVPVRLSATEVEGEDEENEHRGSSTYNRRSGSGRSSVGSGQKGLGYRQSGSSLTGRWSQGGSPPDEHENLETPVPDDSGAKDYFSNIDGSRDGTRSAGSGSSGERADAVGELNTADAARLASNSLLKSTLSREKSTKNPEELRRRGSVDERTMTMSAGRLYIANPDADSD